ncbi:hypothetical protein Mapa_005465 [Marchantia paleacea]|nr:hypothetical protein Mapa_005465 [Marchantia paleacea]
MGKRSIDCLGQYPGQFFCAGCFTFWCWSNTVICCLGAPTTTDPNNVVLPHLPQEFALSYMFTILVTILCGAGVLWFGSLLRGSVSCGHSGSKWKLEGATKSASSISNSAVLVMNGVGNEHMEKHSSMVEELVPEITHHALSYLDYKSLCRVSMTNSAMRRVANDDSAWRALYHKDFTVEQDSVIPRNGWKAHYAVTKAVSEINRNFYKKFKAKSLRGMSRLWLKADYVKCIHPGGELLSGYEVIMENWRVVFNWSQRYDFQLKDVRVRVVGDMAWVTAKEFVNASRQPLLATNCYELHDGQWFIVHHHSSPQMEGGGADFQLFV